MFLAKTLDGLEFYLEVFQKKNLKPDYVKFLVYKHENHLLEFDVLYFDSSHFDHLDNFLNIPFIIYFIHLSIIYTRFIPN